MQRGGQQGLRGSGRGRQRGGKGGGLRGRWGDWLGGGACLAALEQVPEKGQAREQEIKGGADLKERAHEGAGFFRFVTEKGGDEKGGHSTKQREAG